MKQIVIGTAGHIDHGKTSLVKSLTGMETDSLVEEKKRGMTIDLGFAYLNDNVTIIDVPGHEKFIRNMAAGAAILKTQMMDMLCVEEILTVAPTTIKNHAGKGNMNKAALWKAFLDNVLESKELGKTNLFAYCRSEFGEVTKVPKPFDDLVDAWFLNHYLRTQLEGNLPD